MKDIEFKILEFDCINLGWEMLSKITSLWYGRGKNNSYLKDCANTKRN